MPKIYRDGTVAYIRISELPEDEREPFTNWMQGQTRPWIDDLDPQDTAYPWDYERWINKKKTGLEVWD